MTTMTRIIRVAIGTAAVLALMSQAAQAKPIISPHQGVSVNESASTLVREGIYVPAGPANNVAAVHTTGLGNPRSAAQVPFHQLQQPNPRTTGSSAGSANWTVASIGAGILVAFGLIWAAAQTSGRRRVPRAA